MLVALANNECNQNSDVSLPELSKCCKSSRDTPIHFVTHSFQPTMASCFELMHLSPDCHVHMLLMCSMSTIRHLYCTCSTWTWKETVLYASQHDHRLWCIMITMHETAPASLRNQRPEPGVLPNLPTCLLHLCPPEDVDAFHTHSYICHSHPPDLEWATHEVKRMVRFEVARNPFGKIGLRGYSKALQKYNMQLQQRPYAPYQEKDYWSAMRTSHFSPCPASSVCDPRQLLQGRIRRR